MQDADRPIAFARFLREVGLVQLVGGREWQWLGARFSIPGFSHGISLKLTRRVGLSVVLVLRAILP